MWELEIFDTPITEFLKELKRTGILIGILKINEFIFRNEGRSNKKGRIYVTRCFEINNQRFIILLSLLPTVVTYPRWQTRIMGLTAELIDNLQEDTGILYNNDEV